MARILLSITILVGFCLTGCSGGKGQVEAPKITVAAPPNTKDDGKTSAKD